MHEVLQHPFHLHSILSVASSCWCPHRYYLYLAPDLKHLLDTWDLSLVGAKAYRRGFCSRKLIDEFSTSDALPPALSIGDMFF